MPRSPLAIPLGFCIAIALTPGSSAHAAARTAPATPLHFVPNLGQFAASTRFFGFTSGATVRIEDAAVIYQFRRSSRDERGSDPHGADLLASAGHPRFETLDVRATFPGSRPAAAVDGVGRTTHLSHFYLGNDPARWRTHVPGYEGVRLRDLWPGIDLEYHGSGRELEYDFEIAPGADPRRIRVHYDGIERLRVTERGELEVATRFGRTREAAPLAYQVIGGERRAVAARYRRIDDHTFAFAIGARLDPAAPLVIDPVLKYSTLIGGLSYDEVHDIVSDIPGNAYIAGGTLSPDFPASGSPVPNTDYVAYVTKIAPGGSSLVYSVFLGGSANQIAYGIRIDAAGNAYIAGVTGSNDFPTTTGSFDPTFNGTNPGDADMFVAKLSPTGTLLYATYLGGTGGDTGGRVALDQNGIVYVVGVTGSNDYPTTTGAYDVTYNGLNDIVVTGLKCAGTGPSDLVYSTYLGGSADDEAYDIEVDYADDVYIAGSTRSSNFPATGGPPFNGTFDAMVARIKPHGLGPADLSLCMKFGGTNQDYGGGVKPSGTGEIYFSGSTASSNFPVNTGWQTTYGGGPYDAFLMRMNYDGSLVYWSTFVGSTGEEHGGDIALGPQWNPTLVGYTNSASFPTYGTPFQSTFAGDRDIFITSSDEYAMPFYGTFLGGTQMDVPYGITEDTGGRQYVAGNTQTSDYPLTPAAYDTSYNGGAIDVAVTKFATMSPDTCESCASPPDTCCAQPPALGQVEHPFLSSNLLVATRQASGVYPVCVVIYDLGSPLPAPLEDTNWNTITRWSGPNNTWNQDSLGTVFGLTLDKYGNIFVTHTSCYAPDAIAQVLGGAAGGIYRIDANTAKITTFCVLPNAADGSVSPGENRPGLGNISYDCRHDQFFVTDLEDGRIYRIKANGVNGATGTVQETFDPLAPDDGSPGWAPAGERLWGVQVHGDRVYYAVWAETVGEPSATAANEIRSVGLLPSGAFDTSAGSDRHELYVPPRINSNASNPVSDISFSAAGRMLLGERGVTQLTIPTAHEARVLEYECVGGCWLPANPFAIGIITPENSAGGVDYDRFPYTGSQLGRVWATGDALHGAIPPYTDVLYGIQGFRPSGGSIQNSMLIDSDGDPEQRRQAQPRRRRGAGVREHRGRLDLRPQVERPRPRRREGRGRARACELDAGAERPRRPVLHVHRQQRLLLLHESRARQLHARRADAERLATDRAGGRHVRRDGRRRADRLGPRLRQLRLRRGRHVRCGAAEDGRVVAVRRAHHFDHCQGRDASRAAEERGEPFGRRGDHRRRAQGQHAVPGERAGLRDRAQPEPDGVPVRRRIVRDRRVGEAPARRRLAHAGREARARGRHHARLRVLLLRSAGTARARQRRHDPARERPDDRGECLAARRVLDRPLDRSGPLVPERRGRARVQLRAHRRSDLEQRRPLHRPVEPGVRRLCAAPGLPRRPRDLRRAQRKPAARGVGRDDLRGGRGRQVRRHRAAARVDHDLRRADLGAGVLHDLQHRAGGAELPLDDQPAAGGPGLHRGGVDADARHRHGDAAARRVLDRDLRDDAAAHRAHRAERDRVLRAAGAQRLDRRVHRFARLAARRELSVPRHEPAAARTDRDSGPARGRRHRHRDSVPVVQSLRRWNPDSLSHHRHVRAGRPRGPAGAAAQRPAARRARDRHAGRGPGNERGSGYGRRGSTERLRRDGALPHRARGRPGRRRPVRADRRAADLRHLRRREHDRHGAAGARGRCDASRAVAESVLPRQRRRVLARAHRGRHARGL
jgi:hypothetical protein